MKRAGIPILTAILGGLIAAIALVAFLGWNAPSSSETAYTDPARADYVDLLLTLVAIVIAAVGLAVTVGALVIGFVAFKTLREIKEEAAVAAKSAAGEKINETMASDLEPNVTAKLAEILPTALQTALLDNEVGHRILSDMAQRGELDEILERVAMRSQGVGPEPDEEGS